MMALRHFLLAACVMLTASAPALAAGVAIERFTLKNGMEVIVLPNHRVPAINHTLWFKVGAADDPVGKSGLAHFHEHMMFQGTDEHAAGEYSQIIARIGGQQNAFTGEDATGYYASIPKDKLALVMELEADRLQHLNPSEKDAQKEREVIIEERRSRIDNNPHALFGEQMQAALLLNHPYRLPIIGWKHEMEGLSLKDVMNFHRRYTQPINAILILSGDITAREARPLVEKYYGGLPPGEKPDRHWKKEPPHIAPRFIEMRHSQVNEPFFQRDYMAPSMMHGKTELSIPLAILGYTLGGSHTSRLYQQLVVKDKIATSVNAGYNGFSIGPSTFGLNATPAKGQDKTALIAAIDREIARIQKEGITKGELSRAKTLLKADAIYSREGLEQMGHIMGWIRVTGLPADTFNQWPEMIEAVTLEQVKQAANEVLVKNASVSGWLLPEEEGK